VILHLQVARRDPPKRNLNLASAGVRSMTTFRLIILSAAAHRVPAQLVGIVPAQGWVFGDPTDATAMFYELGNQTDPDGVP
jgi:hypothetical protein